MKIDPQNPAIGAAGSAGADNTQAVQIRNSQNAARTQQSASPEPSDTVQLSPGQATIRQLVAQLDQAPEIRQEQVSSLRSAIDSGQYNPSNAQVAEALAAQTFGASEQA